MKGRLTVKVYYEDTDCMGVVYHASYLRFFERGRTELIEQLGQPIGQWSAEGAIFAAYKLEVTFKRPARLGDLCEVLTEFGPRPSEYRIVLDQKLIRGEDLLCEARVQLVCLDSKMSPRTFPPQLLELSP